MTDILKSSMQRIVNRNRNRLKYSAGQNIFCPHCNKLADYRNWAMIDNAGGETKWQGCIPCLMKRGYLLDLPQRVGWVIITDKPLPKPIKAENSCIPTKESIAAYRKARREHLRRPDPRKFPKAWMAECASTRDYVEEYLKINGLHFVGGLDGYILNTAPATQPVIELRDCTQPISEEA